MPFFRIFGFLALFSAVLASEPVLADPPIVIKEVKLSGNGSRTQITLYASDRIPVSAFVLDTPRRVILDLPEVTFNLSDKAGKSGKGLVSAFRFGHFAAGQSRMVFDIKAPVVIGEVKIVSTVEGAPHRIVIEIAKASQKEFIDQVKKRNAKADETPAVPQEQASVSSEGQKSWPLVVIDPGHGGIDGGAHASGSFLEKNFTLSFAKILREELVKKNIVRVTLTRDKDIFIPLGKRREFAQKNKAALFISVHADSFGNRGASPSGATVYTLSEKASDQEAASYAERENRADEIAGIEQAPESNEVADILFDLMQRETKSFSSVFSRQLTGELKQSVKLNLNPRRSAGFVVLRAPDVPAVLLEMGYLSNSRDVEQMQDEMWQRQAAQSVAKAVAAFIEQSQPTGTATEKR